MTVTVHAEDLRSYGTSILAAAGLPDADAAIVAASLVDANLRGVDSHGVTRIPVYVERLRRRLVNPNPTIKVVSDSGGVVIVDGDNGMGAVVTSRAVGLALERLPTLRNVAVAIHNNNHYASGAFYLQPALARGAVGFLYSNAPSTMAAWGGVHRYLGTNPYTFAVPAGRHGPIILDMATSVVARGKIILAAQRGESIPEGWAVDATGAPTTDAQAALEGSVLPFGGPKGYGIAVMVEVMAGILTGANFGPAVGDLYENMAGPQGVGTYLNLLDVSAFLPYDQFTARMDTLIDELKATGSGVDGPEVLVPGEIEARTARQRTLAGIPLSPDTVAALEKVAPEGARMDHMNLIEES